MVPIQAQNSITGTITDPLENPIPYANVILQKKGGDTLPKGSISDNNGAYTFKNIPDGTYQLEVSVLGYSIKKSEEFSLLENKVLNFKLEEEAQTLSEVVVKSKLPVIKQTAEKLVVDLEKSELINTSLKDVMRKVPGVLVTNNGISITGNRDVRLLINGKTTEYMDIQTLLRDFPADNISKIEVVEQPGAEYEASGSGALINIILKKNVRLGTHGNLSSWIGRDQGFEYGTGASIASYKNKLNWQARFNQSEPTWRDDLFLIRTVGEETYDQTTIEPYNPKNFRMSANLDYYLNEHHSIGIGGRRNNRISQRIASSKTIISNTKESNTLFSENSFDIDRVDYNLNPYYEFKTETDKLLIDFNYIHFRYNNTNDLYDLTGSTIPFTNRRYIQDGKFAIKTYRLDYTKTFSDFFKLSLGTRYADVDTDND
ncbi:MAG: TonB-dependent receptor, partial [Flavobacteriaceae bacterium]